MKRVFNLSLRALQGFYERNHAVANLRLSGSNDAWKKKVSYCRPVSQDFQLTQHITKRVTAKTTIYCNNDHKNKAILMGALVGALFNHISKKTINKQHVNRVYDSESGTTILFLCFPMNPYTS